MSDCSPRPSHGSRYSTYGLVATLTLLACTKSEPTGAPPPSVPVVPPAPRPADSSTDSTEKSDSEATAASSGQMVDGLFAGIDLDRDPEMVAKDMAARWCSRGGEAFSPHPGEGTDEDDYRYKLKSCDDIKVKILDRRQQGGLSATLLEISVDFFESRELLFLRSESASAVVQLHHGAEDQSGEAGDYSRTHLSSDLQNITGSPTPEWIGKVRIFNGDSFEADRCHASETNEDFLTVCREREATFECFSVLTRTVQVATRRPRAELHDCDVPRKELVPRAVYGHASNTKFSGDFLEFTPDKSVDFSEPDEPYYEGKVPLDELFEDESVPVDTFDEQ